MNKTSNQYLSNVIVAVIACGLSLSDVSCEQNAPVAETQSSLSSGPIIIEDNEYSTTPGTSNSASDRGWTVSLAKIASIVSEAKTISGYISAVSGAISTAETIAQFLGWMDTPDEVRDLSADLDAIGAGISWQITQSYIDGQVTHIMGAIEDVEQGNRIPPGVGEDDDSRDDLIGLGRSSAWTRAAVGSSNDAATDGGWLNYPRRSAIPGESVNASPFHWKDVVPAPALTGVANGPVFDWRLGAPALLKGIAQRLIIMGAVHPNFVADGSYRTELQAIYDNLAGYYQTVFEGVQCADFTYDYSSGALSPAPSVGACAIVCADVNTGISVVSALVPQFPFPNPESQYASGCGFARGGFEYSASLTATKNAVRTKLPTFAMRSMLDTLYALLHPAPDLTTLNLRIPLQNHPDLCLDTQGGGTAAGTPLALAPCAPLDTSATQIWVYARATQEIENGTGLCLDVKNANPAIGTPAQLWDCNRSIAQQWSYNPANGVLTNALGNVLDVEWGNLAAGTPVWTWTINAGIAQQWWADRPDAPVPHAPANCGALMPDEGLFSGQDLWSCDGRFALANGLAQDGTLVVNESIKFDPPPPPPAPAGTAAMVWSAGSWAPFPGYLIMQADGNLVVYDSIGGAPAWSTGSYNHPGAHLELHNDGNIIIVDTHGTPVWP